MKNKTVKERIIPECRQMTMNGIFYYKEKERLEDFIEKSLQNTGIEKKGRPFAIIAPNANYSLAGSIYGASYSLIANEQYDTVIIMMPLHRQDFRGLGLIGSKSFETPFGKVEIDSESNEFLRKFSDDFIDGQTYHEKEYSAELQLPYLMKTVAGEFKILPVIIGRANTRYTILLSKAVNELLAVSDKKFLIVVPTNLNTEFPLDKTIERDKTFIKLLHENNAENLSQQLALEQISADGTGGLVSLLRLNELMNNAHNVEALKYATSEAVTKDASKVESYISAVAY
ncbi:MAG: AmmeMemoRadiSam system protein B [Spirochaetales bacterium]|nr:AmmeMemoRadiSam system protein B [Spirochaetales bacterium]